MADRAVGRHAIRPGQYAGRHVHDARRVGAHIGALVVEIAVVDGEDDAVLVDRGADPVQLLARVIGGDQMLAPVLDPFHRPVESFWRRRRPARPRDKARRGCRSRRRHAIRGRGWRSAAVRACATAVPDCGAAPWRRRAVRECRARRRSGRWRRAFPAARRNAGRWRVRVRRCGRRRGTPRRRRHSPGGSAPLRCEWPGENSAGAACASSSTGSSSISIATRSAASSAIYGSAANTAATGSPT